MIPEIYFIVCIIGIINYLIVYILFVRVINFGYLCISLLANIALSFPKKNTGAIFPCESDAAPGLHSRIEVSMRAARPGTPRQGREPWRGNSVNFRRRDRNAVVMRCEHAVRGSPRTWQHYLSECCCV